MNDKITQAQLDWIIDSTIKSILEEFDKLQSCYPHYILVAHTGEAVLYLPKSLDTVESKDRAVQLVTEVAQGCHALAIVWVMEAWMVQSKSGEKLDMSIPPSSHPRRVEILTVSVETHKGTKVHLWPIVRGERVTLGRKQTYTEATGRFCNLLSKPWERN